MLSELPLKDHGNNKPTFLGDTTNTVMFIHSMFLPHCHNYNLESKPAIATFAYLSVWAANSLARMVSSKQQDL